MKYLRAKERGIISPFYYYLREPWMEQDSDKKIGKAQTLAILIIAAFIAILIGASTATQTPAPIGITSDSISDLEGGTNAETEAHCQVAEISLQQNVSNSWGYLCPVMKHVPPMPDPAKAAPKPEAGDAPSTFNWRDCNGGDWTTPAKSQGGCGSCWDFAALGALEAVINIEMGDPDLDLDLSEQYVLSCLPAAGSCGGGQAYSAFRYIQSEGADGNYVNGIIPESCFPYQADDSVPCSDKCPDWQSQLIPISGYDYWYPYLPDERDAIKTQLMGKGPLVTSMTATDDFINWGLTHHDPDDYYPYPGPVGGTNHEVVIVGYKDDPSIDNGGYWICKNSWGTGFGYDGFYNVEYGSLHHGEFITYVEYSTPILPDLVITDIAPDPISGTVSEDIKVTVTVKNQGGSAAGGFYVHIYEDLAASPMPHQVGDDEWIGDLAAGASTSVVFTVRYDSEGGYSLWAQVDTNEDVAESNEGNNVYGSVSVSIVSPAIYTIATTPSGLQVKVDGISYTAPASFEWNPGSSHTISASSPQNGGTGIRYVYASWSDGGAQSHIVTVGTSDSTMTANFNTQYQLTMAANYGTTNPSVGMHWYNTGSSVQISATAPSAGTGERYAWNGWTGSGNGPYTSTSNPTTITMNAPITQVASWTHQFWVTIATAGLDPSYPATITVVQNGATNNPITYATWSDWADIGSTLTISNPVAVSSTERYHTLDTTSWTVTSPTTHSVTYYQQFKPTISVVTAGIGHTDLDATNYATLTYYRYGSSGTFNVFDAQSYNDWIDIGSTATLSNPSSGSTSTHRWHGPGTTSWVINDDSSRSAVYWEQFKPTISVVTAGIGHTDLDATNYASLTYYRYGSSGTFNVFDAQRYNGWIDAGSAATLSNPSSGSTSTHRWYCPGTASWTIDNATPRGAAYHEQFKVTITPSGLDPSHAVTITVVQNGATNNATTFASWSDWADVGSTLSISSSVGGGWIGDWSTGDTTSWTVNSAISATVGYQRSYTGIYILVGGVVVGATGVSIGVFITTRRRRAR